MVLIADCGSTKTHWALIDGTAVRHCSTAGLNPLFADEETYSHALKTLVATMGLAGSMIDRLYFYGAGCGTAQACQRVRQWIGSCLSVESMDIAGDLLGACRAVCGHEAGLVGILGTGSNMCYYDGSAIARQRVSTGFILGDEGSGNHIGKRLLKDYLEERMPKHISTMFHDSYPYTTSEFLDRIYRQPSPNRFLASFVDFAASHRSEPYIQEVLADCFGSFFEQTRYFGQQARLALSLVGGLVASFGDEIRVAASRQGICLGAMEPSPIGGLVSYHSK